MDILIADDSVSMRESLKFTLEDAGHDVVEATNGKEALDKAKETEYELIISDVNMPVMNGLEFIKNVRQDSENKFTPILVLTTESGVDKKTIGKDVGASGWIVKPFQAKQLLDTIAKVCG